MMRISNGNGKQLERRLRTAFTMIELMVVIVVIGILAAVVYVGISSWRDRAAETEVKANAQGVLSGMENAKNWSNGYPVFDAGTEFDGTNATKNIYTETQNVTITYASGDATSFCVDIQSTAKPSVYLFLDTANGNKTPIKGTCAGGAGGVPFDPNMATEFSPSGASLGATAVTVDSSNGDVYYKVYSRGVYWFDPSSGTTETIASGFNTDAMVFGGSGTLYVFSDSPGGDPGPVTVQALDIATGTRTDVSSTTINRGKSLYKDGNTLYAGGRDSIISYDLTTGLATTLYTTYGNIFTSGITVVDSYLYYVTSTSIYKIPKIGGTPTLVATIPDGGVSPGGKDLVYSDGNLYTMAGTSTYSSIYQYNLASGEWTQAVTGVAPNAVGCVYPSDFAIYGDRAVYFSAALSDWSGCSVASNKVKLYFSPID